MPQPGHDQGNGNEADIVKGSRQGGSCPESEAGQSHQFPQQSHAESPWPEVKPGRPRGSSFRSSSSVITDRRTEGHVSDQTPNLLVQVMDVGA